MKTAKVENSKRTAAGLFPLPIVPRALSFFPLPSLPTTQRGLGCGERPSKQISGDWEPVSFVKTAERRTRATAGRQHKPLNF